MVPRVCTGLDGISVFPDHQPTKEIVVNACLTGISGATDDAAYTCLLADKGGPLRNISEVKAINVAVALQTFIGPDDYGRCVVVYTDNMAAVNVLSSGRGMHGLDDSGHLSAHNSVQTYSR